MAIGMIKAVIFDVDGVLLDSFEANLIFFQHLMTISGYRPPTRDEFPELFHLSMWDVIRTLTGLSSEEEIRKIWEVGRSRVGYDVGLLRMPEGAEETVKTLSLVYPLAIVTSRIRESVFESPQLAKLQPYFPVIVSFQDTVNRKPHPEPLLLAAKRLSVAPQESVYIGDVENDLKAAKAAGMKVIIYSKNKFDEADFCTSSFEALPALIAIVISI